MKKRILLFILFLMLSVCIVLAQSKDDPKYKVNPTADRESPTGVYIPKDLEDCFQELKSMLHPSLIQEMQFGSERDMVKYHLGLGMWIRNNWSLWKGSRLKDYFNGLGVFHPDDMSGIILDSFWRDLNNSPINLQEQIKHYQDYWKKMKKEGEK